MAVDYLAPNKVQFDALQSLQDIGQIQAQQQQTKIRGYGFDQQRQQDGARSAIAAQAQGGDLEGAQAAALGNGDYDLAKSIGGMAEDKRKRLAANADWMGRAANALLKVPAEKRAAVFTGMVPTLTQHGGYHADELRNADLSDEGLAGYVAMSQSVKDQLGTSLTQRRIEDVGQDNQRADRLADNTVRNTDNVIEDRGARRGLVARGQDLADSRGRYGIGVASGDRRRGQDVNATTSIRGQDLTDKRTREIAATRPVSGGRGSGRRITPNNPDSMIPGTAAFPVTVTSPAQAKMLPPGTYFKNPQGKVMKR
jgi:hypothetical protein